MWAALSPLVLWLAAAAASAYEDGFHLFQWMGRFSQVLKRPFSVEWTAHTLKFMLVSLLLSMAAALRSITLAGSTGDRGRSMAAPNGEIPRS